MTYIRNNSQLGTIPFVAEGIAAGTVAVQTIADIAIGKEKIKTGRRLTERELQLQASLATMGHEFRGKELATKMAISKRRDKLFKDIALYVGLSLGAVVVLTAVGTILIKKKKGGK